MQICGLCAPGWALTSSGCSACPGEDKLAPLRGVAIALFAIFSFLVWYFLSWLPIIKAGDAGSEAHSAAGGKCVPKKLRNIIDDTKNFQVARRISQNVFMIFSSDQLGRIMADVVQSLPPYLKIYITFFQISASFLVFGVTWPALLMSMMVWLKSTLFLDVLQLPGMACLWNGISFQSRLLTYTLGPIAVILLLLLPVAYAWVAGYKSKRDVECSEGSKWSAATDAAWKNIMYWIFLIYPVVSLTTLQAFDCQPPGLGRLAADLNELCPSNTSFLRVWSFLFIIVYPLGIPLFCYCSMVQMGVHLVAQDTVNSCLLRALLAVYMQRTANYESRLLISILTEQDGRGSESKIIEAYNTFFDDNQKIRKDVSLQGVDSNLMATFLLGHCFSIDESIPVEQFKRAAKRTVHQASLFVNTEDRHLTKQQAIALLMFDWNQKTGAVRKSKGHSSHLDKTDIGEADTDETLKIKVPSDEMETIVQRRLNEEKHRQLNVLSEDSDKCKLLSVEIFKLANRLKQENVISVPSMSWRDTVTEEEEGSKGDISEDDFKKVQEEYVIHPDLPDDHEWSSQIRFLNFLGLWTSETPSRWKTVNKRRGLKVVAVNRVGFVFASYKVTCWFWEIIEMVRK